MPSTTDNGYFWKFLSNKVEYIVFPVLEPSMAVKVKMKSLSLLRLL